MPRNQVKIKAEFHENIPICKILTPKLKYAPFQKYLTPGREFAILYI